METTTITVEQIEETLNGLWDIDAQINKLEPAPVDDPRIVATFNDENGIPLYAIECELALGNSLGAALTKIPSGGAEDATRDRCVPDNIADNLHEVLNICSAVFANSASHRIMLDQVHLPGQDLPEEVADKLGASQCLLQLQYELEGYQSGRMSLVQFN